MQARERTLLGLAKDVMEHDSSFTIKPTLVDIRCQLMAAVAFAQIYAESHPQDAEHLIHFVREIQKMSKELGESVYGKPIMDRP